MQTPWCARTCETHIDTPSQHSRAIAANVLARRFSVDAGVSGWVSDITYVPTREGWLYLAVIIALHTRQVLGYSLAEHMPDELVLSALRNACHAQPPAARTVFHSDRGSQYASDDFCEAIGALQMVASMSREGNCWDNAVAESFFATLKAEEITQPYETKQHAHRGVARYIHGFYNPARLHSSLGYLSPDEYARRMKMSEKPTFMRSAA
jgi:putative transposase